MDRRSLLKWVIITCLIAFSTARELEVKAKNKHQRTIYNHTLATILVEYASTVYMSDLTELFTWTCPRCNDLKGFQIIELIVDVTQCLQAFVGVAPDLNAIIIAFRGTRGSSIQNWIADLYWKQLDIDYPGMEDAMVHHGFYSAYHNTTLRPGVLSAVNIAKELYGDLPIMVTGHSMGGAMAAFCGLDLTVNFGLRNVSVMTFGQPRIGNSAFASYYSKWVPNTIRVTHEHDMVPHLPPYYRYFPQKTYRHFPTEVWLYNDGLGSLAYTVEKVCDGSGEDPSCSRYRATSPKLSSYASSDVYSLQPTPRASNFNEMDMTTVTTTENSPMWVMSPVAGKVFRQPSPSAKMAWESPAGKCLNGDRDDLGEKEISFRDITNFPLQGGAADSANAINIKQEMPNGFVMLRLIIVMVGRKLSRNPNTYSSILGLLWSLISFKWNVGMPSLVKYSIKLISDAGLGMAMFSLGLFMALQPQIIACGTKMAVIGMVIRFIGGPLVMSAASIVVGLRGVRLHTAIVQAALPQGIVPFVFAREYGLHPDILSTGVIFGMLVSLPVTLLYYILLGL